MPDREKVIKALRICFPETQDDLKLECSDCPYEDVCNPNDIGITLPLILDIRALLKEQEAIIKAQQFVLNNACEKLKEQEERIKELELEKGWDESPDMMGKW